jgi:hypothetical protein
MANRFSEAYGGGAVVFNNLPYLQMRQNMLARQEAKQQAVDNYYRDLSKSLTPAGMAGNDVEDFTNKVNTWRDYVTKNRDVLSDPRNPNYGEALNESGYLYNDALGHAESSKRKVADGDRFNQLRLSHPEYTITDNGMTELSRSMQPVMKGGGNLDWAAVAYNPKDNPFTADDLIKYRKSMSDNFKMDKSISTPTLIGLKTKAIEKTSSYSDKTVSDMADYAHTLYKSNPAFKHFVDAQLDDPNVYSEANKKFKEIYGEQYDIKHGEEMAATLLMPQLKVTDTQPYAYSPTIINNNNNLPGNGSLINDVYDEIIRIGANHKNYIPFNELSNTAQAALTKDLIGDDKSLGVNRLAVTKNKNGDWRLSKVVTNDNGTVTNVRDLYRITEKGINLLANTAQKQKQVIISQGNPQGSNKSYKYNGKTYTTEQLTKAAQASGMSIDDYIKQLGLK